MAATFGDNVLAEHRCLKPFTGQVDLNQDKNKTDATNSENATCTGDSVPDINSRLEVRNSEYKERENKTGEICNETDSNILNAIRKLSELRDEFLEILENSVRTRVCNIPDSSNESSVDKLKNAEFKQSNLLTHQEPKVGILFWWYRFSCSCGVGAQVRRRLEIFFISLLQMAFHIVMTIL